MWDADTIPGPPPTGKAQPESYVGPESRVEAAGANDAAAEDCCALTRAARADARAVAGLRHGRLEREPVGEERDLVLTRLEVVQPGGGVDDRLSRGVEVLLHLVEREGGRSVRLVQAGEREHLVHVPVRVVVGEDGAVQVGRARPRP